MKRTVKWTGKVVMHVLLFVASFYVSVHAVIWLTPYEDVHSLQHPYFKVLVQNESNYSEALLPEDGVLSKYRLVSELTDGTKEFTVNKFSYDGKRVTSTIKYKYKITQLPKSGVHVQFTLGPEIYIYEIRGSCVYPLFRKIPSGWQMLFIFVSSFIVTILMSWLAKKLLIRKAPETFIG